MKSIVDWLLEPDPGGALTVYQDRDWARTGYPEVAADSLGVANLLRDKGIGKGDRIAVILPTGRDFFRYFFGAMALGAVPTVVAPPGLHGTASYPDYVRALLRTLEPAAIVAERETLSLIPVENGRRLPVRLDAAAAVPPSTDTTLDPALGDDLAIIQFTSGSTGTPRAVRLSSAAVVNQIEMMKSAYPDRPAEDPDSFGSWLPMHHDMGLIGCFLMPASHCKDVWLMRPEHFVRRPALWLEMFGRHGVNHSATPNFALERIVRLVGPATLEGMDFSTWRTLIVGSDRINLAALRSFYELLAPYGLRSQMVKPGYGMAETTLAISCIEPWEMPHALLVDAGNLQEGTEIPVLARESLTEPVEADPNTVRVVGCGVPLPGSRILVADEEGEPLPDGRIGELVVECPSMFSGYLGDADLPAVDGTPRHRTGDLGFRRDGHVYVLGRIGNSVKINGNFVTAEDVEMALADRLDIHHDKLTVVLRDLDDEGAAALLIFQQRVSPERAEAALGVLARMGLSPDRAALIVIAPLAIPRTTSGKPKRVALWQLVEERGVAAKVCYVGSGSPLREQLT
ncbi:AMP-binding protein [Nocardia terpenica]|uniref:AMP-binding protein n=1 Tax=Nocardia terpenica TaxID=455432 RepID=UPI0012FD2F89|nr:AMP-binding protein [Nocardia terpenica]